MNINDVGIIISLWWCGTSVSRWPRVSCLCAHLPLFLCLSRSTMIVRIVKVARGGIQASNNGPLGDPLLDSEALDLLGLCARRFLVQLAQLVQRHRGLLLLLLQNAMIPAHAQNNNNNKLIKAYRSRGLLLGGGRTPWT